MLWAILKGIAVQKIMEAKMRDADRERLAGSIRDRLRNFFPSHKDEQLHAVALNIVDNLWGELKTVVAERVVKP